MPEQATVPDYSGTRDDEPGDNLKKSLMVAADRQEAIESEIEDLQNKLDEAKGRLKDVSEREIPQLLEGMEGRVILPDGRIIIINEKIRASLPKEKAPDAINWLDEHGHSAIVKRRFTIEFGKNDDKWADKFERDLRQRKKPLNVKRDKTVHAQTLTAFVKESLSKGEDIPLDLFGVYRQRVAKIDRK